MQFRDLDLDFLKQAAHHHTVSLIGHWQIPRGDAVIDRHRAVIWANPFDLAEFRHRDDPAKWLAEIRRITTTTAHERAYAAIERLERDGAEDRDLLFRARLRKTLDRLRATQETSAMPQRIALGTITP